MDIGNLSHGSTGLGPGPGRRRSSRPTRVGGGSNLYLAASLRAPTRDVRAPRPRARRRPGAAHVAAADLARATLEPLLRARRGGPARAAADLGAGRRSPAACGRRRCDAAGHTCDRVPLAIDPDRCVNAKWCHTGCIFGAKNSRDHELPRRRPSSSACEVRPNCQVELGRASPRRARTATCVTASRSTTTAEPDAAADRQHDRDRVQGADPRRRRDGQRRRS